jgi:glutathione S-transferase
MLTLYDFGNSVCCQKVRITMRAKGLDWESVNVDLFKAEQYDPRYLKLNPRGIVPTLVHHAKPIIESTLICEYLDQTAIVADWAGMQEDAANVRFSNRRLGVKRFQTIHPTVSMSSHGLVLLFGIATRAVPSWDSKTRGSI